jgi:hypothetical protein
MWRDHGSQGGGGTANYSLTDDLTVFVAGSLPGWIRFSPQRVKRRIDVTRRPSDLSILDGLAPRERGDPAWTRRTLARLRTCLVVPSNAGSANRARRGVPHTTRAGCGPVHLAVFLCIPREHGVRCYISIQPFPTASFADTLGCLSFFASIPDASRYTVGVEGFVSCRTRTLLSNLRLLS